LSRRARLNAFACARGHAYLHAHDACPQCGDRLRTLSIPPEAILTLETTVRVTPDGVPFALGIAVTRCGRARTLCRLEGPGRRRGYDRVVLEKEGDEFVARTDARARTVRAVRGRSRGPRPIRRAARRS
jgi:hypothetical protein